MSSDIRLVRCARADGRMRLFRAKLPLSEPVQHACCGQFVEEHESAEESGCGNSGKRNRYAVSSWVGTRAVPVLLKSRANCVSSKGAALHEACGRQGDCESNAAS